MVWTVIVRVSAFTVVLSDRLVLIVAVIAIIAASSTTAISAISVKPVLVVLDLAGLVLSFVVRIVVTRASASTTSVA